MTPYLVITGAANAIDFYQRAFGAKVQKRHDMPDGKVMHVWSPMVNLDTKRKPYGRGN